MSKRHQSSRRKSYGRRQHELRERGDREPLPELRDVGFEPDAGGSRDAFAFLDPRPSRMRFALGE